MRNDMQPREQLVFLASLWCQVWPDYFFEPVVQELFKRRDIGGDDIAAGLIAQLQPCGLGVLVRLALDVLAVALASGAGTPDVAPVAVLDRVDRSFAVVASA